ncbi:MAG TPA: hypothetical protein VMZ22_10265 [Acidimicrobiales bacterium]|nr:hypothetical protein [Acidimicrobiales bacterium]
MAGTRFGLATIVASNYLAHARVLAKSLQAVDSAYTLSVLVIDDGVPAPADGIEWLTPDLIGVDRGDLLTMAAMYDVIELSTALKPALLRSLLNQHDAVLYLDPDIEVFAPLDDLAALAETRGITLTPHRLTPAPSTGRPVDREFLAPGAFNLGFIGVGKSAVPFLDWWAGHLAVDCIVAPEEGLFVDQRWMDLAVVYFDHAVSRDPGCNVAWWNLDERELVSRDGELYAGGAPLRFFHFSGYDPDHPEFLYHRDLHHPHPIMVSDPVLKTLVADHADRLAAAGWNADKERPYRFGFTTRGDSLTSAVRRAFRWQLTSPHAEGPPPPSPFDPSVEDAFARWANPTRRTERRLRLLHRIYRRGRGSAGGFLTRYARVFATDK